MDIYDSSVLTEIANGEETLETRCVGVCMSMYGWALLFSPIVSGLLADPTRQYPFLWMNDTNHHDSNNNNNNTHNTTTTNDNEEDDYYYDWPEDNSSSLSLRIYQFLNRFPFFLPNAMGSLVCLGSLIMVIWFVPETLVVSLKHEGQQQKQQQKQQRRNPLYIPRDIWRALMGQPWYSSVTTTTPLDEEQEEEEGATTIMSTTTTRTTNNQQNSLLVAINETDTTTTRTEQPLDYGTLPRVINSGSGSRRNIEQQQIQPYNSCSSIKPLIHKKDPKDKVLNKEEEEEEEEEEHDDDEEIHDEGLLRLAQTDIHDAIRASVRAFHVEEGTLMSSIHYRERLSTSLIKRHTGSLVVMTTTNNQQQRRQQQRRQQQRRRQEQQHPTVRPIQEESKKEQIDPPETTQNPWNNGDGGGRSNRNRTSEATISTLWANKTTRRQLIVFW